MCCVVVATYCDRPDCAPRLTSHIDVHWCVDVHCLPPYGPLKSATRLGPFRKNVNCRSTRPQAVLLHSSAECQRGTDHHTCAQNRWSSGSRTIKQRLAHPLQVSWLCPGGALRYYPAGSVVTETMPGPEPAPGALSADK